MRHLVSVEEFPDGRGNNLEPTLLRQSFCDLFECDVAAGLDQAEDEGGMRIQNRALGLALPRRADIAFGTLQPGPRPRRCNPDIKPRRRLARRHSALDRPNHPLAQIHAVRLAHPNLQPIGEESNHAIPPEGIPPGSRFRENALASLFATIVSGVRCASL